MRRVLLSLIILLLVFPQLSYGQTSTFTKQEVESDILYLKKKLIQYHPNLFTYSSPEDFAEYFAEIEKSLPSKISSHEAFRVIAKSSAIIKDGHTVFLPKLNDINSVHTQKKFFPFQIHWDGEALFVIQRYKQKARIEEGDKILNINGIKTSELIPEMLQSMMRDGYNRTYPVWVLNTYFLDYYSFFSTASIRRS